MNVLRSHSEIGLGRSRADALNVLLARALLKEVANSDPRFTGWDGGVPVRYRGKVVGSVAVSGLDQSEDAGLARLGVAAILEATED